MNTPDKEIAGTADVTLFLPLMINWSYFTSVCTCCDLLCWVWVDGGGGGGYFIYFLFYFL